MRIKLKPGIKEDRFEKLDKEEWETMKIIANMLFLSTNEHAVYFILKKEYKNIRSKFNYDFVRRLIEDAN